MRIIFFSVMLTVLSASTIAKCKYEAYNGTWVGYHQLNNETNYLNSLQIEVTKCTVSGKLHWIDNYNVVQLFNGVFINDTLVITLSDVIQGKYWNPDMVLKIYLDGEMLKGIGYYNQDAFSYMEFRRRDYLSDGERTELEEATIRSKERFGEILIFEKSSLEYDSIKSGYIRINSMPKSPFKMLGTMDVNGITADIDATFAGHLSYMKMTMMNIGMEMAKNETVSWQYDGFNKKLKIDSLGSTSNDNSRFESGEQVQTPVPNGGHLAGEPAAELLAGGLQGEIGGSGDHVGDGLGLGQIDAAVEKGAQGELAGAGESGAGGDDGVQGGAHGGYAAVAANFDDVLGRV